MDKDPLSENDKRNIVSFLQSNTKFENMAQAQLAQGICLKLQSALTPQPPPPEEKE